MKLPALIVAGVAFLAIGAWLARWLYRNVPRSCASGPQAGVNKRWRTRS